MSNSIIWPGVRPFGMTEEARKEVEGKIGKCTREGLHVCHHLVEMCQNKIGEGSQAKVYKYYDTLNGKYVAGKAFKKGKYEKAKEAYKLLVGKEHCAQMLHFCDKEEMIFEELYSGPDLNNIQVLKTPDDKLKAIYQIALGIRALHSVVLDKEMVQSSGEKEMVKYPLSHRDLKPTNILFNHLPGGDFRVDIGDFGSMLHFHKDTCTKGYESPSFSTFYRSCRSGEEMTRYNFTYGQKDDLFSFGLICLTLIKGNDVDTTITTQEALDKEVDKVMRNISDPSLVKVCKIVKEHLFRADPKEIADIGSFMKMLEVPEKKGSDIIPLLENLSLNPIPIPFVWDTFPILPEFRAEAEHQMRRYMASHVKDRNFCTGHITSKENGVTFQFEVLYNSTDVFLNTGEILHEGDNKIAYKCYSPISRRYYALKVYNEDNYRLVEWVYNLFRDMKNIVHYDYRDEKRYLLEPLYPLTLQQVLKAKQLNATHTKLTAMREIANGVKNIQSSRCNNQWYKGERFDGYFTHRRLHPDKIFVSNSYDISSGHVAYLHKKGDADFRSPEEASLSPNISDIDYCRFAYQKGRGIDIWRLGQIFGRILQNSDEPILKTRTVDPTLLSKEREILEKAWMLVDKMLSPDPEKRCDIHEVVSELAKVSHV